jgi:hypothetical protein
MKRLISLVALACAPLAGMACTFGAHIATYHFDRSKERQEVNPGAYAECNGYTAGAFLNSLDKPSAYAGYTVEHGPVALTAGVVTGYGPLSPMVAASIALGAGFRLSIFPPHGHKSGGLHITREF